VQLFHAHLTLVPAATVFVPGLKELLLTEIPPTGGGVLIPLFGGAVVPPPLPPHPLSEATASNTKAAFIVKRLLAQLVSQETLRMCAGRNKRPYMLGAVDDCYRAVSGGDDSATVTVTPRRGSF
jgi:hypothetical protein